MAKTMTKAEVIANLAEKTALSKKAIAGVLEELTNLATQGCKESGQFVIPGIGKAVKSERKARSGRNPQTGETIKIDARTVVKFRLSKSFQDSVIPPKK